MYICNKWPELIAQDIWYIKMLLKNYNNKLDCSKTALEIYKKKVTEEND